MMMSMTTLTTNTVVMMECYVDGVDVDLMIPLYVCICVCDGCNCCRWNGAGKG